ncbi:hypothetical protein BMG00_17275 [Thioclava marina]|uniref:Uncharacterized protein n=1 Tax=Thioclava marina TaxID=1915077 RepID=A0ABX3MHS8_9RHOB|nr:hypothetical protein [Thioclava marina]OOY10907.1 hypothetical protein BMG00_17275 [Thioclava marina]
MPLRATIIAGLSSLCLSSCFEPARAGGLSVAHDEFRFIPDFGIEATSVTKVHLVVPPSPTPSPEAPRRAPPVFGETATDRLKSLIAQVEAGRGGYDAIVYSARVKPGKRPSQMTISEIYAWIAATPNQGHAIGRYQIIPQTLRRLVSLSGLPLSARFDETTQDFLADLLLEDAGYGAFLDGEIERAEFMNNLARIWAGLPTISGRSYYHGIAGNRAVIDWRNFETAMDRIFSTKERSVARSEVLNF